MNCPVFKIPPVRSFPSQKTDKLISANSIINGFILLVVKKIFNFAPCMDVNAQNGKKPAWVADVCWWAINVGVLILTRIQVEDS